MTRQLPDPSILLMHGDLNAIQPDWGECGVWRWWTWASLNPSDGVFKWDLVNDYLRAADAQGRKTALSVLVLPGVDEATGKPIDSTPAWVYESAGVPGGWPVLGGSGTFPRWNDYAWDAALQKFIAAFGARFGKDTRIHSVWITFAKYGETVTDGLGSDLHNPGRYFSNVISWYDAAFPNTPLAALITAPTDRLSLANMCWERGIVVKFNALVRDSPTHVKLLPTKGEGHVEIALKSRDMGAPVAWEHFYPANAPETYWAILTFLGLGGTLLDLPAAHLDALADSGLWDWALEVMQMNQDRVGMWVARDTQYPPTGNGWEHGWPGPWERNVSVNATCYAPGSDGYKAAPISLTGDIHGHGGIGHCATDLTMTCTLPEGTYDVEVVYAPAATWMEFYQTATLPGTITVHNGPCWVHSVVVTPASPDPVDPNPEPPDLSDDVAKLAVQVDMLGQRVQDADMEVDAMAVTVAAQEAHIDALFTDQAAHAAKLAELDAAMQRIEQRTLALEGAKAAALSALEQLREALL